MIIFGRGLRSLVFGNDNFRKFLGSFWIYFRGLRETVTMENKLRVTLRRQNYFSVTGIAVSRSSASVLLFFPAVPFLFTFNRKTMARIIFQKDNVNPGLDKKAEAATGFVSDRDVLKKRSKKYLKLIDGLDAKTLADTKGMDQLMKAIQEEFGTAALASLPLGIVSKCYLGHPYEVHTLDLSGSQIIKHYKASETMEADFEKARTVAQHSAYAMVEVYKDKIILIREDGTATKL